MLPIVHVGHCRDWQGVFRRLALCRPMPLVPPSLLRASVLVALALLTATHAAAHAGSVAFWRITMSVTTARSEVPLSPDDVYRMAPGAATLETTGPVDVSRLAGFDAALLAHFAIEQDVAGGAARIVAGAVLASGLLQVDMEHASIDPSRALALRATLHAVTDHTHRVIGRVDRRGVVTSLVFDATTPRHVVAAPPRRGGSAACILAGRPCSGGFDAIDGAARHRAHPQGLRPPRFPRLSPSGRWHVAITPRHRLGVHRRAQRHARAGGNAPRESAGRLCRAGHRG